MGKAGRFACILTPMLLTIASLVTQAFVEIGGWSKSSDTLNGLYFMKADFTNLTTSNANDLENSTDLTAALAAAKASNQLAAVYQIHLWNYCSGNTSNSDLNYCSPRKSNFYFDPVTVWHLNATNVTTDNGNVAVTGNNDVDGAINNVKNGTEDFVDKILGGTGKKALDTYKHVAKWMFIAYQISFWATLATIAVGILAIFSRIGSFLTWLFSIVSAIISFAASLTATILFAALTGSFKGLFHPYGIKVDLGTRALAVTWIATALSIVATLFWLFSVCCCSGRSNPHHRNNKGGLWNAEQKGQGYEGHGRGLRVEKTGGYQRVSSPFLGGDDDRVPLTDYPQKQSGHYPHQPHGGAYEPFRHN
ncbi:hypothetical protein K431DRAFT_246170 [Polychaeton citri CBS 116435]|uniref:Integral membrane protein n=1 Tax=Polychaeton citri CBS 116435 TaxID=1314669 RepID=A0A9P4UQQ7_9PEZI|nr:hypothetical protein K431DRAFT_246170 [Polychaeton citri CBS 116435]